MATQRFFIFTPKIGEVIQFDPIIFFKMAVQPPTRYVFMIIQPKTAAVFSIFPFTSWHPSNLHKPCNMHAQKHHWNSLQKNLEWLRFCFFQKVTTLRIIGPSKGGVWICIARFWDLQTTNVEIPTILRGTIKPSSTHLPAFSGTPSRRLQRIWATSN